MEPVQPLHQGEGRAICWRTVGSLLEAPTLYGGSTKGSRHASRSRQCITLHDDSLDPPA